MGAVLAGTVPPVLRRAPLPALGLVLALLAACGGGGTDDYDADFEAGFLSTCETAVGADQEAVCQCTYDRLVETVPYERAERIDRRLRDDPEAPLPDDIADLIAGCVAFSVPPSISTTTSSTASTSTTAPADGASTTLPPEPADSTTTTQGEAG